MEKMSQMLVVAGGDSNMGKNNPQNGRKLKVRNSGKIFFLFTKNQMTMLLKYVSEGESNRPQIFLGSRIWELRF